MDKLQLYLNGTFFQEQDIELPAWQILVDDPENSTEKNAQLNFELNVELREDYIKSQVRIMKVNFLKQIIKCQYNYHFCVVLKSKVNWLNAIRDDFEEENNDPNNFTYNEKPDELPF